MSKKGILSIIAVLAVVSILFLFIRLFFWPQSKKPNILLITTQSLRPSHLSCYGYRRFKTGAIDNLAGEGLVFENSYCDVPVPVYGYASILSGKTGSSAISRQGDSIYLNISSKFLSEYLQESGYETVALTANPELSKAMGFGKGFNTFQNIGASLPRAGFPFASKKVTEETLENLKKFRKGKKPVFLWADYAIPRFPYIVPSYFLEAENDFAYDRQVVFLDSEISKLMAGVKKLGLDNNTIVIFTATNGEALGEHEEPTHGVFLYDATVKTPLIIRFPKDFFKGNRIKKAVSNIDITPTVLDILGIDSTEGGFDGISLLDRLEERRRGSEDVYLESLVGYYEFGWSPLVGIVSDGYKYIQAPEPELYDLAKDPHELKNIASFDEEKAEELKNKLFKYITEKRPQLLSMVDRGEDPKERAGVLKPYLLAMYFGNVNVEWLISIYRNLLAMDPDNKTFKYVLAKLFMRVNKPHLAEYYLEEITAASPDSNQAWELLGMAYAQQKEGDNAVECYEKAIAIIYDMPVSLNNLAWAYAQKGVKLEEALKYAQRANELLPNQPKMMDTLAEVYFKMGDKEEALEIIRKAASLDPQSEYLQKRLGEIEGFISS